METGKIIKEEMAKEGTIFENENGYFLILGVDVDFSLFNSFENCAMALKTKSYNRYFCYVVIKLRDLHTIKKSILDGNYKSMPLDTLRYNSAYVKTISLCRYKTDIEEMQQLKKLPKIRTVKEAMYDITPSLKKKVANYFNELRKIPTGSHVSTSDSSTAQVYLYSGLSDNFGLYLTKVGSSGHIAVSADNFLKHYKVVKKPKYTGKEYTLEEELKMYGLEL